MRVDTMQSFKKEDSPKSVAVSRRLTEESWKAATAFQGAINRQSRGERQVEAVLAA